VPEAGSSKDGEGGGGRLMPLLHRLALLLPLALVGLAAYLGLFAPADQALRSWRFEALDKPASGDIVFVEIDAHSLSVVGVWPWPRQVHAELLDRLLDLGASEVVFDVDFSTSSTLEGDLAFEHALERAGGYAMLAAFQQVDATGQVLLNLPLPRFAQHAPPVLVNVDGDGTGAVQSTPAALPSHNIPSLALGLVPGSSHSGGRIVIDFGIDLHQIDRIPAAEIFTGRLDPARIANKQVVIGASAIELRDFFPVPRFGVVPGPLVQIAAAETLKANRNLIDLGPMVSYWIVAALGGLVLLMAHCNTSIRMNMLVGPMIAVATEIAALTAQGASGTLFDTVPVHSAIAVMLVAGLVRELAIRRRQSRRLQRQRAVMRHILERVVTDNFDGIVVIDAAGMIVAASQAAQSILQYGARLIGSSAEAALPMPMLDFARNPPIRGTGQVECAINGQMHHFELVSTRSWVPTADNEEGRQEITCLTFQDVTERHRQEARLAYLARHDAISGALSRQAFVDEIDLSLSSGMAPVVATVRLRRLRQVNTTFGHELTERIAREVARRLKGADLQPARLGTELFGFIVPPEVDQSSLATFISKIASRLEAPYEANEHTIILETAFGLSASTGDAVNGAELLRQSDVALFSAPSGRRGFVEFQIEQGDKIRERQALDIALRRALAKNEFYLEFQPQIDMASGAVIGVEALVRWRSDELGRVSPGAFIPLAEETGLVVELGEWVMIEACRQAASWGWQGRLSVNVSVVQFRLGDVGQMIRRALAVSGLPAHQLDIEITESLFVDNDAGIIETLSALRELGVGIAIDDFGTGYSSLSYLSRLPIDKIKIDQSFVRALPDPQSQAIVDTIVAMAHRLGKLVVAEGVETEEQRDYLSSIQCEVGQGYLFGRPASPQALGLVSEAAA
jgi:predicted signal transduction protein with EAL and GGDEF domain